MCNIACCAQCRLCLAGKRGGKVSGFDSCCYRPIIESEGKKNLSLHDEMDWLDAYWDANFQRKMISFFRLKDFQSQFIKHKKAASMNAAFLLSLNFYAWYFWIPKLGVLPPNQAVRHNQDLVCMLYEVITTGMLPALASRLSMFAEAAMNLFSIISKQ